MGAKEGEGKNPEEDGETRLGAGDGRGGGRAGCVGDGRGGIKGMGVMHNCRRTGEAVR